MSVAFRREGDEEHLEPRFEIPIPPGPNRVTPRGLARIVARVAELQGELAALRRQDDAGERIKAVERDLRYWQTREITAEVVAMPGGETVEIGTIVRFRLNGTERELEIVGDDEANPAAGRIAYSAPLARAMIGAEAGEAMDLAGRAEAIEIMDVKCSRGAFCQETD